MCKNWIQVLWKLNTLSEFKYLKYRVINLEHTVVRIIVDWYCGGMANLEKNDEKT